MRAQAQFSGHDGRQLCVGKMYMCQPESALCVAWWIGRTGFATRSWLRRQLGRGWSGGQCKTQTSNAVHRAPSSRIVVVDSLPCGILSRAPVQESRMRTSRWVCEFVMEQLAPGGVVVRQVDETRSDDSSTCSLRARFSLAREATCELGQTYRPYEVIVLLMPEQDVLTSQRATDHGQSPLDPFRYDVVAKWALLIALRPPSSRNESTISRHFTVSNDGKSTCDASDISGRMGRPACVARDGTATEIVRTQDFETDGMEIKRG